LLVKALNEIPLASNVFEISKWNGYFGEPLKTICSIK
jgi:hypothetical protein